MAVLGIDRAGVDLLRDQMMGTPTIASSGIPLDADSSWGPTATEFLEKVRRHPSRASSGYYTRYFHQYFRQLTASLDEICRVTKGVGHVVIVVQDSYYKDLRLDLASAFAEMITVRRSFADVRRRDFPVRTRAAANPRARKWRSEFNASETVLYFRP